MTERAERDKNMDYYYQGRDGPVKGGKILTVERVKMLFKCKTTPLSNGKSLLKTLMKSVENGN